MYTVTAEEAGALYGISGKTVASDCEKGAFKKSEARRSGKNWLITKQAADLRYGGGSEPAAPMNPLLLVFTTLEAAELWNRDSGDVRWRPPVRAIGQRGWRTVTGGNRDGAGLSQEMPWNVFMARRSLKNAGSGPYPDIIGISPAAGFCYNK